MADNPGEQTQVSRLKTEDYGSLPPGALIGRYEIVSVLGQGGFGITYRAHDAQLEREVAIKEYLPSSLAVRHDGMTVLPRSTQMADDFVWGRARFLDEAKIMARFANAPAIVRVHEFLEANGTAYVVMPLLEGETLEGRLKRETRLQQPAIERILYPLLDGLEQVHAAGFLHRDIKPANIILDAGGSPTLIDFGASRAAMQGRTQAMTAVFTPGYAPLEQFVSGKQGPWTDIYALAATLYTCINGKPPPNAMERMIGESIVPATEIGKRKYAPSLLTAIDAGLVVKAENRPQSIEEWREILATGVSTVAAVQAISGAVEPAVAATSAGSAATPRNRNALYAGAVAALLILASGGGYFMLGSKPSPQGAAAPQGTAVQDLKVEELEKVLADRRKADASAAEKKQLEDEAQRKAETDAAAKRTADTELADAQMKRQKAEDELAKLKADMEARRQAESGQRAQADAAAKRAAEEAGQRKAEAEMTALRQAESDAQTKAASEAAAKKQADEALAKAQAERQKADEEAVRRSAAEVEAKHQADAETRQKAEAEAKQKADAEAKQKADAAVTDKTAAEAAETALRLGTPDRQRIQVALTSLGFNTGGSDGALGPRSRQAIAAWQQKTGALATGFLTAAQRDGLLRSAAPAVARWDDEQKKLEEDKKKADEAKAAAAAATPPPAAAPATPAAPAPAAAAPQAAAPAAAAGFDGAWTLSIPVSGGHVRACDRAHSVRLNVVNGQAVSSLGTVFVDRSGNVSGTLTMSDGGGSANVLVSLRGSVGTGGGSGQISGACTGKFSLSR
jgi:peptidoglycan hydrolase-like protein with peptidoglycan-binding domain